ncbi:MAG: hypothetical protein ACLT2Z_09745 [Eubacterium sp.]
MVRRKCDTEKVGINTSIRFANVNAENILCNAKYVIKGYKTRQFVDVIQGIFLQLLWQLTIIK